MEEILLPPGWIWEDEWKIDHQREGDRDGFEYAFDFGRTFSPKRQKKHFVRRRCHIRTRVRDPDYLDPLDQAELEAEDAALGDEITMLLPPEQTDPDSEGWEYALDYKKRFHPLRKRSDTVRRRRYHRELVPVDRAMDEFPLDRDTVLKSFTVGTYLKYDETTSWQLRAHIYQSRNLIAEDDSGFADPYLKVPVDTKYLAKLCSRFNLGTVAIGQG